MRLLGCATRQEGERLEVGLYWQALRGMEEDYKVFVHLIDASGGIVAQHDGMPREWSYPTSLWSRGEVFVDRVELEVGDVAGGVYSLGVGMYEVGGDRLGAVDVEGRVLADGRALLEEAVEVSAP
jgi:hypothetical protein